jgi:NAD(P)H-nitrite reductase large subunit
MKSSHIKWQKMKPYAAITAICIVLAIGLNFLLEEKTNKISDMRLDSEMIDKVRGILGDRLDPETMAKLKKAHEGKLSEAELEKLKEQVEEKLDPSQIERLRRVFKSMGGGHRPHP